MQLLVSYKGKIEELAITQVIKITMVEFTESIGFTSVEARSASVGM
jgi:hypothetical protein